MSATTNGEAGSDPSRNGTGDPKADTTALLVAARDDGARRTEARRARQVSHYDLYEGCCPCEECLRDGPVLLGEILDEMFPDLCEVTRLLPADPPELPHGRTD
jgi:hypothetical protein